MKNARGKKKVIGLRMDFDFVCVLQIIQAMQDMVCSSLDYESHTYYSNFFCFESHTNTYLGGILSIKGGNTRAIIFGSYIFLHVSNPVCCTFHLFKNRNGFSLTSVIVQIN